MTYPVRTFGRAQCTRLTYAISAQPRRFAHQSYGNTQSGHQQGLEEKNPKEHLEHPGPETPASQGQTKDQGRSSSRAEAPSSGGKPTIQTPKSDAESHDPEVKKHNEEMKQRADRSHNQLSEEDNKVDKRFWKGNISGNKSDDTK